MRGAGRCPPAAMVATAVSIWSGVTTIDWPIAIIGWESPDQVRPPGVWTTPGASCGSSIPVARPKPKRFTYPQKSSGVSLWLTRMIPTFEDLEMIWARLSVP